MDTITFDDFFARFVAWGYKVLFGKTDVTNGIKVSVDFTQVRALPT